MTRSRLDSVDALRGLVMVIMALDHVRDFFHVGAMTFQPDDLSKTTTALFFTRWVTHLCAPVFMFTAGIGAYFFGSRPGRSKATLSRFLLTRGLWLILLEFTALHFGYFLNFTSGPWFLSILWVIGLSMVVLSLLVHLPVRVLAPLSLLVIVFHNAADGVRAATLGSLAPLWNLLHQPGVIPVGQELFIVAYPLIPWVAVMAAGYCFGPVLQREAVDRRRVMLILGAGMVAAFVVLRALNVYGDPRPWSTQVPGTAFLSFLGTSKYPPSPLFLLMTLGPAFLLLRHFDGRAWPPGHPLLVIGRVPLFFFLLHFLVAHLLAFPFAFLRYGEVAFLLEPMPSVGGSIDSYPVGFGYSLPSVYLIWLLVLALSFPLCRWFAGVKNRRSDWWLGYL
jgi:uncharacterized membrane protein